jgi:NitT/TauT family transport system substrate-binding protein
LQVTQHRNGSEVSQLLDRGELDAGLGGHLQTLAAALSGTDQAFFAAVGFEEAPDHLPVAMVVAAQIADGRISDGARIAMSARAAISDLQLRIFAAAEGIDYRSLDIVTMPFSEMQPALEKGDVDAASVPDPFADQIETSGVGRIVDRGTLSREMPDSGRVMITGLVSTKRWIEKNSDLAAAVVEVVGSFMPRAAEAVAKSSRVRQSQEPAFDTRLHQDDLQLAFDLAARFGIVANRLAAETVIAIPALD